MFTPLVSEVETHVRAVSGFGLKLTVIRAVKARRQAMDREGSRVVRRCRVWRRSEIHFDRG